MTSQRLTALLKSKAVCAIMLTGFEACGYDDIQLNSNTSQLSTYQLGEKTLGALAAKYPSVSGYYCSDGDLLVPTTDAPESASAQMVLTDDVLQHAAFLCHTRQFPNHVPSVIATQAKYSFEALRVWRDAVSDDFFATPTARGLGLDYQKNQLWFLVADGSLVAARDEIAALAHAHQLPDDVIFVSETAGPRPTTGCTYAYLYDANNLNACFRPIPGGVAMTGTASGGGNPKSGCTITSANKRYIPEYGSYQDGFVTASHCLQPQESQSSDWLYQPADLSVDNFVGTEFVDPLGWPCGSYTCKNSDSSWVWHYQGGSRQGTIAQTLYWNGASGSCGGNLAACLVNPVHPRFYIYDSVAPVQGMEVERVGMNSGWSTGTVTSTCMDLIDGAGHKMVCNATATNEIAPGDSGSPLFYWWWFNNVDTVEMVGLAWGQGNTGSDYTWFSPWSNVAADLGTMDIAYHSYFEESAHVSRPVAGDFNGDGKTDIALVGVSLWTTVPVAFSNGDGTFVTTNAAVANFPGWTGTRGVQVVAGDVNHDGRDDLIAIGGASWTTVPVAFSNGDGSFTVTNLSNATLPGLARTTGVRILSGDVNGDLKSDLILVGGTGWTGIWTGVSVGDGTFTASFDASSTFASLAQSSGVQAISGDFNGDGYSDVALSGATGWTTIPVAFRQAAGGWSITANSVTNFPTWSQTSGARLLSGDVNADGKSDLLLSGGSGWTTVPVALSDGTGNFTVSNPTVDSFPSLSQQASVKIVSGRFDSNTSTDLALVGGSGWWTLPLALAQPSGGFSFSNQICP